MSLRIMATADVHLGMKFGSYRTIGTQLIEARFNALQSVVAIANDRDCNMLVIAGDLFHRVGVVAAVILRATQILEAFNGEVVAVLPGNHDFVNPDQGGLWKAFRDSTGDRTVILDSAHAVDLRAFDLDAVLMAAPCDSLHGHDHRLGWMQEYQVPDDNPTLIGVAHGSIDGLTLDAEGSYFPMTRSLLASLPPALWIIGHTHRQHDLQEARLVVPGTPEPDGFDFPHPGQAAYIQIDGGKYSVEAVQTGTNRFADIQLNLDREQPMARQLSRAVPADTLVRLTLGGTLDSDRIQELNAALDELRETLPYLSDDISAVRRLVTQADADHDFATGSFAHQLVTALLDDDDADGAATAVELLAEVAPGGSAT